VEANAVRGSGGGGSSGSSGTTTTSGSSSNSSLLAVKKVRVAVTSPDISARAEGVSGDIKGTVQLGSMSLVGFGMDARVTSAQIAMASNSGVTIRCQALNVNYVRQIRPEPMTCHEVPLTLPMPVEFQCTKVHLSYILSSTTLRFVADGFQLAAFACTNVNHTALQGSVQSIRSDGGWVEAISIGVGVVYTGDIQRFEQLVVSVEGAEIQITQQKTFEMLLGVSDELSSAGGDGRGYLLPHAHISPTHLLLSISNISLLKAKIAVALKELNLDRKRFDFPTFNGTEGTTSNDVLSHYLQVTKSFRGLFLLCEALGPGRIAAQGIGGAICLASGTHVGRVAGSGIVVGGVVAGAAFDTVGQIVSKGKMVRSASSVSDEEQSDSYQFGDFTRGVAASVVDTAKTGGDARSGGDSGGYQFGDFTVGTVTDTLPSLGAAVVQNREVSAGAGTIALAAAGTAVAGPVGAQVGAVVGGVVAGAVFDTVGQIVSKGKMVRSASSVSDEDQSDSYQFGDFTRGVAASVVDTAKTGGDARSGGDSGGYQFGDFTRGVAAAVVDTAKTGGDARSGGNSGGYQFGDFTRGALSSMTGRTAKQKPGEEEGRSSKGGGKSAFGLW
jgi:hypothetical protein